MKRPLLELGLDSAAALMTQLKRIGPALVLAAVVLGPGSITLSTISGGVYGYRLLWVPLLATVLMIAYTWMAAKLGLVSGASLLEVTRRKYGRTLAAVGGITGFLAILAFQAGNSAAVGFCGNALLGQDPRFWSVLIFLPALGLMLLPDLYGKIEFLVKLVVGVMILSFVGTLAVVGFDWTSVAEGLVPGFPDRDSVLLALGMTATTFSVAAAAYQSHLMKEKKWGVGELATHAQVDTVVGIGVLGAITVVVLMTSAGVLGGRGGTFSAEKMALQLEPLVGPAAYYLFLVGFFFASFSSLVVNPLIGATLLVDGMAGDSSIDSRSVRGWTIMTLLSGVGVVVVFGASPVELLRAAQAMAAIAFPVLGFLIWKLSSDRETMGGHANGLCLSILAVLGYLAILGIVGNYLYQILFRG